LTDNKATQTIVVSLIGSGGIGGPGTTVNVNANFVDYASSIRGEGSLQIFCDGRTYTVRVYTAPFTNNVPQLSSPIAQAAASQNGVAAVPALTPVHITPNSSSTTSSPSTGSIYGWFYTSSGGVTAIPYPFVSRQMFYVDFEAASFTNVTSIYFNLNYDTDLGGTQRGVETTFVPTTDQITGYDTTNHGWPYIRRQLFLGTCSRGVCNYDPNPRNFRLTVTSTYKDGTKYTEVLTQK